MNVIERSDRLELDKQNPFHEKIRRVLSHHVPVVVDGDPMLLLSLMKV